MKAVTAKSIPIEQNRCRLQNFNKGFLWDRGGSREFPESQLLKGGGYKKKKRSSKGTESNNVLIKKREQGDDDEVDAGSAIVKVAKVMKRKIKRGRR